MKFKRFFVILLVLLVVIILEVLLLTRCGSGSKAPEPPVMTPSPTADLSTPEPAETSLPTPEILMTPPPTLPPVTQAPAAPPPTPDPTPEPTPEPTATPAPTALPTYGTYLNSGSFSSDTGTKLNMHIDWTAYDDGNGNAVIAVTGSVSSYSLYLASIYDGATISLGSYSTTSTTRAINQDDSAGLSTNPIFLTTLTVPLGTSGDMTVSWRYGGSYSGVDLPFIEATGFVSAN